MKRVLLNPTKMKAVKSKPRDISALITTHAWLCQLELVEMLARNVRASWASVIEARMKKLVEQLTR